MLPFDHTSTVEGPEVSDVKHAVRNEVGRGVYHNEFFRIRKAEQKEALDEERALRAAGVPELPVENLVTRFLLFRRKQRKSIARHSCSEECGLARMEYLRVRSCFPLPVPVAPATLTPRVRLAPPANPAPVPLVQAVHPVLRTLSWQAVVGL